MKGWMLTAHVSYALRTIHIYTFIYYNNQLDM